MPDRNLLILLYEQEKLSTAEIGNRFNVQAQTVRKWLHKCGIEVRQAQKENQFKKGQSAHNKVEVPPKHEIEQLYIDDRMTSDEIGKRYGVTGSVVRKWLQQYGIASRAPGIGLAARGINSPTDEELYDMIHVQHLYYRQVAERYGVDQSAVQHRLDVRGIERPKSWYDRHNNPESLAELKSLYDSGLSLSQIADRDGMERIQLTKLFKNNGILIRKDGWQGGKRFDTIDGHSVRSTYEQRVADWLCEHGIEYTQEPRLPFGGKSDFLANGWYIEIWGVTYSQTYKKRQAEKQAGYKAYRLLLIELTHHMFAARRNGSWMRHLEQCLKSPNASYELRPAR